MKLFICAIIMMIGIRAWSQETDTTWLRRLIESRRDLFAHILDHPDHNEVQILYTRIDRDAHNVPHFTRFSYRLDCRRYFYPASTVKLPTLIFALEKLNRLAIRGVSIRSTMITDSSFSGQTRVLTDSSAKDGKPTVENYIKRILLVSDNDAYNRLYEFVGRREINEKLKAYGLSGTRIVGRLAVGDSGETSRHTNAVDFYNGKKRAYHQLPQYDASDYPMRLEHMLQGKGYLNRHDQLIMQPFDFSDKNVYPLTDQQLLLQKLLFPEQFPESERFRLTRDQYRLIYRYMSMWPTESRHPRYSPPTYFPAYCKWLFYGGDSLAVIQPHLRIFNKIGDSYGYDIDNAYIVDFRNHVEFLLSAVVQSNDDGIYNDNKYEYKTVCLPFMKNIARLIYAEELKRPRRYKPKLGRFKFHY